MNTAAKLLVPVTFAKFTRHEVTLDTGSVVEWEPEDGNLIRIRFANESKVISADDATPVEWDDVEEMWVEE